MEIEISVANQKCYFWANEIRYAKLDMNLGSYSVPLRRFPTHTHFHAPIQVPRSFINCGMGSIQEV
jgi:hypothetical protein